MWQLVWSPALVVMTTSRRSSRHFIGFHRQRVIFKTAVLVWKCLHDAAPRYLADLCVPAASIRTVVASLGLQSLGPSWCPGLGRLLASAALLAEYGPRTMEQPTTNCPSITRTVAFFIQAPAQGPPVSALLVDSAGCSCGCRVHIARLCCDFTASLAPTTNIQTRLLQKHSTRQKPTLHRLLCVWSNMHMNVGA